MFAISEFREEFLRYAAGGARDISFSEETDDTKPSVEVFSITDDESDFGSPSNNKRRKRRVEIKCPKEIQFLFNCTSCPYRATRKQYLKQHIITQHYAATEKLVSNQCGFRSKRKQDMNRHVLSKHTPNAQVNWFQCEKCPFKSKRMEYLLKHVLNKHA